MSIKAMDVVKDRSESRGTKRLVMFILADHADDYGFSWPGVERIAHHCRIQPRNVYPHLKALRESGEIIVWPRPGRTNVYQIALPGLQSLDDEEIRKLGHWGVNLTPDDFITPDVYDREHHTNHKEPKDLSTKGSTSTRDIDIPSTRAREEEPYRAKDWRRF